MYGVAIALHKTCWQSSHPFLTVRCRSKTSVAVSAAVEVKFEGRRTTGWLEKKVEPISVPLVELEADYRSYRSLAMAHKRAKHSAHKPIDQINLRLVHHELYCAT